MIKTEHEWMDERVADIILHCADVIRDGDTPNPVLLYELEGIVSEMRRTKNNYTPFFTLVNGYLDKFRPIQPAQPEDMWDTVGLPEEPEPEEAIDKLGATEETETDGNPC